MHINHGLAMQNVSFPQLLHEETKTNCYVPFQQTKRVKFQPITTTVMHSFISTKTVDSFFCHIIESQVSGDNIIQFNNMQ